MVRLASVPSAQATTQTVSSMVAVTSAICLTTPEIPGGTMMRCSTTAVSCTTPRISPADTASPTFTRAWNAHLRVLSSEGTSTPRVIRSPTFSYTAVSGR